MNTSDFSASGSAPGTPPGQPPTPPVGTPDKVDEFFDSVRRAGIVRGQDRWIGGVASGVALRLGIDALLVRAAFGVLALVSGAGLVLYAVGWALLPEQVDGRIHLQEAIRGRFDAALAGAAILFVIGVTTGPFFGWWGGGDWFGALFWVALTVFAVYGLVTYRNQRGGQPGAVPPPGASWPPAGPSAFGAPTTFGAPGAPGPTNAPGAPGAPGAGTAWASSPAAGPNFTKAVPVAPPRAGAPMPGGLPQGAPGTQVYGATWDGRTQTFEPPRRTKSAGVTYVSSVLGLTMLTFAALLLLDRYGDFAYSPWLTAVGVGVVLTGLAIVLAGIRGRSSGGLTFLAIVAILIGAPAASWASDGIFLDGANRSAIGDSTFAPTTVEEVEDGYSFGLGDITLDLTSLDLPPADERPVTVPLEMGAGNITIILEEGASASARVTLGAGQVYWELGDADDTRGGLGTSGAEFQTDDVRDGATPDIHLVLKAGAGEIFIKEES